MSAAALASGLEAGPTPEMKTTISIPDRLFKAADRFARQRKISRSRHGAGPAH